MNHWMGSYDGIVVPITAFTKITAEEKLKAFLVRKGYTPIYIIVAPANDGFAKWTELNNAIAL
jgi:hypothetical protein